MKSALITGAAGGLGTVFCESLLKEGYQVFACDIKTIAPKTNLIPIIMDITDIKTIEAARTQIEKHTKALDLICDNAGMQQLDSLVEADPEKMSKIVDVNLKGMMMVNRVFFDMILPCRGRIIITSSEIGYHQSQPFHGLYSITKHAVDAYADSLRRELNCLGLKVVKLQPGGFKTNIIGQSSTTYDDLLNRTKYYHKPLTRMRGFVMWGLSKAKSTEKIERAFLKAATKKNPRARYRINNMFLLKLLDLFGEKGTDIVFKIVLSKGRLK